MKKNEFDEETPEGRCRMLYLSGHIQLCAAYVPDIIPLLTKAEEIARKANREERQMTYAEFRERLTLMENAGWLVIGYYSGKDVSDLMG